MKKLPLLPLLGFVVSAGLMVAYFTFFVAYENIRDDPKILVILSGVAAVIAIFGAGLAFRSEEVGKFYKFCALSLALLSLGASSLFGAYIYYFAYQLPSKEKVFSAKIPPSFSLADTTGKMRTIEEFKGKKNVLLVFYRGNW